jgi:hypothetical protein
MSDQHSEQLLVRMAEFMQNRFFGKYRGLVTDVDDPKNLGRIRAKVPAVYGDEETSPWALPCAPFTGDGLGNYMIPPVGAGVWVEFEAGDISQPIWSGGWWGKGELPKNESGTQAKPPIKIIRSEQGLQVSLDDDQQTITLSDQNGQNIIKIKVQGGMVYIKGTTKAVVEAPKIELVENSYHPVVFGDELMNYLNQIVMLFNAHMHPGETLAGIPVITPAPPVPILTPPTPMLISKKVTSG